MSERASASQQLLAADVVHSAAEQPAHNQAAEAVHSLTDDDAGWERLGQLTEDCGESQLL